MAFDPNRSFDDLPALPPASEPYCHTRDCRSSASWRIPNNATLINAAPRLETQAGPKIGNIVTPADRLFRHAKDSQRLVNRRPCLR